MTRPKDCKSCQENVSLSLANRKLAEKNEWKFWYQTRGHARFDIPQKLENKLLFFGYLI